MHNKKWIDTLFQEFQLILCILYTSDYFQNNYFTSDSFKVQIYTHFFCIITKINKRKN